MSQSPGDGIKSHGINPLLSTASNLELCRAPASPAAAVLPPPPGPSGGLPRLRPPRASEICFASIARGPWDIQCVCVVSLYDIEHVLSDNRPLRVHVARSLVRCVRLECKLFVWALYKAIQTHTHTHTHKDVSTHTHTHTHTHINTYVHIHMYILRSLGRRVRVCASAYERAQAKAKHNTCHSLLLAKDRIPWIFYILSY